LARTDILWFVESGVGERATIHNVEAPVMRCQHLVPLPQCAGHFYPYPRASQITTWNPIDCTVPFGRVGGKIYVLLRGLHPHEPMPPSSVRWQWFSRSPLLLIPSNGRDSRLIVDLSNLKHGIERVAIAFNPLTCDTGACSYKGICDWIVSSFVWKTKIFKSLISRAFTVSSVGSERVPTTGQSLTDAEGSLERCS